ncbi:uncharacterized protein [Euwallacea similis]|uniref:uncharacterized protein n=1 Tax=Euwallacea similis TaxID=1736056 RepID=UPI00344BB9BB
MNSVPTLSLFFGCIIGGYSATLPSYIKACSKSDPNRKECFIQRGNEALPQIIKGDKSIKLQSLSPAKFDVIEANVGNLKLTLNNVDIFGLETIKLIDMDIDWDHQTWFVECEIKRVTLVGSYVVDGQILVLPVRGDGPFNITIESLNIKYTIFYKIEIKRGKEFSIIDDSDKLDWKFKKVHFQFDNLFDGNQAMGDNVNKFLNENGVDVMNELSETVSSVIKTMGHQIYNAFLENIALEEMFLQAAPARGVHFRSLEDELNVEVSDPLYPLRAQLGINLEIEPVKGGYPVSTKRRDGFKWGAYRGTPISSLVHHSWTTTPTMKIYQPFVRPSSWHCSFLTQPLLVWWIDKLASCMPAILPLSKGVNLGLLLAGLVLVSYVNSAPLLPPYIRPCSKSDPNLKDCYVSRGNEALPSLIKGDKQLRLSNLLPLKFPRVDTAAGSNLRLSFIDLSIYGFDTAKLIDMETDFRNQKIYIRVFMENSTLIGDYDIDGKIMVLPVKGSGPFEITIKNFDLKYHVSYNLEERDGVIYAKLRRDDTLEWKIEKAHFRFDNLFNGNKQMGDAVNNFINENDQDVLNELGSGITGLVKIIAYKVGESVFGNVPFDDLFLS